MNLLTLATAGQEQTFEQWGFADPILRLRSHGESKFTLRVPGGDPGAAAVIGFEQQVQIWKDRTVGANGGFTGGTLIFQGRRTDLNGIADATRQITLEFSDPWYDLEHIVFQHYWITVPPGETNLGPSYFSRINLFQDISLDPSVPSPWGYLSANQQIAQIVSYAAQRCAANLQLGVVDVVWNVLMYGVKAISCADALLICLRTVPDAVTYFDYSTTPPTLHIRQRQTDWVDNTGAQITYGTLPNISLPYAGADFPWQNPTPRWHRSSKIKPRPDLQATQVVLQYQQTNSINGVSFTSTPVDAYPPGSTGAALRALVAPIDVRGSTTKYASGSVTAAAIDPTQTAFWQDRKPDLKDAKIAFNDPAIVNIAINDGSPDCITIVDHTGAAVSLTDLPNEIVGKGGVASWMTVNTSQGLFGHLGPTQVVGKEVTITATLSYTQKQSATSTLAVIKHDKHVVSVRIKLTNSAVGTVAYAALASQDPGEPIILGLAKNIYGSLATLQWEGEHVLVEDNIFQIIGPGYALNLKPGAFVNAGNPNPDASVFNPVWTSMQAMITESTIDFTKGETAISFGPAKHLAAGELFDLLMLWRPRFIYDNPNIRATGQDNSGGSIAVDQEAQKENTNQGVPQQPLTTTLSQPDPGGYQTIIQHDANAATITVGTVNAVGTLDAGEPTVQLANADLGYVANNEAEGPGRVAKWREFQCCDLTGAQKMIIVASSAPE